MNQFQVGIITCVVFQLFLGSRSVPVGEPLCSKFSYDEMLLEKMIRMEFDVKTMEKNMFETEKSITERQVDMTRNMEEVLQEIDKKMEQLKQTETALTETVNQKLAGKSKTYFNICIKIRK